MARRENFNVLALGLKRLHFTGCPDTAISAFTPVKRADTNRITGNAEISGALVPDGASENSVKAVPELVGVAILLIEVSNDGRVRLGRDIYASKSCVSNVLMVVNLTVPAERRGGQRKEAGKKR